MWTNSVFTPGSVGPETGVVKGVIYWEVPRGNERSLYVRTVSLKEWYNGVGGVGCREDLEGTYNDGL